MKLDFFLKEMKNLNERMAKMTEEIENKFNNVGSMKTSAEERKNRMVIEKEQLKSYKLKISDEVIIIPFNMFSSLCR